MEVAVTTDELIARAKQQQSHHKPMPLVEELQAAGQAKNLVMIITCMDPRLFPERLFNIDVGDALICRNLAGHPQPQLNDILALDIGIGIGEIMIVHHTDCGATHFTNAQAHDALKARHPDARSGKDIDARDFGAIHQRPIEQSVVDDVMWLRKEALYVRDGLREKVRGFLFDLKTGELREVEA